MSKTKYVVTSCRFSDREFEKLSDAKRYYASLIPDDLLQYNDIIRILEVKEEILLQGTRGHF